MKKTILFIAVFLAVKSYAQVWSGSTNTSGNTFRNGNVGIGTTNPLVPLHIKNGDNSYGSILANASESAFSLYTRSYFTNTIDIESFRLGLKYNDFLNNGYISFYRGDGIGGGFLGFATNGTERLRITKNGDISISSTIINPGAKLHINNGNNSYGCILANSSEFPFSLFAKTLTTSEVNKVSFQIGLKYNLNENNGVISFYRGGGESGGFLGFKTNGAERMQINAEGKVSIGFGDNPTYPGTYKLYVKDGILTEKVKVALSGTANWADYVFSNDYKLKSLSEVESYIKENNHLPNIPSSEEIKADGGLDVAEMMAKQMEKIEELTLYTIQQQKELEGLKSKINQLLNK